MSLKIIGAGLARTGTASLRLAIEALSQRPCYHSNEFARHEEHCDFWLRAHQCSDGEWREFFASYGAAVGSPTNAFWRRLMDIYPDALVLLSVRDPSDWWASASKTVLALSDGKKPLPRFQQVMQGMRTIPTPENREEAMAAFKDHIRQVTEQVPSERLLVWDVADGWAPLCSALGVPVPTKPFPKTNTMRDFRAHSGERLSIDRVFSWLRGSKASAR